MIFFSTLFLSLHLPSPNQKNKQKLFHITGPLRRVPAGLPQLGVRAVAGPPEKRGLARDRRQGAAARDAGHARPPQQGRRRRGVLPRFHLQDPVLSADAADAIGGTVSGLPPLPQVAGTMFSSDATFFNYAPCVLSESYTGAQASLTGLNFAPTLLQVSRSGRRRREIKRKERARQRSGKKEEKLTTPKKKLLKKQRLKKK